MKMQHEKVTERWRKREKRREMRRGGSFYRCLEKHGEMDGWSIKKRKIEIASDYERSKERMRNRVAQKNMRVEDGEKDK